jgi:hypothetical protein
VPYGKTDDDGQTVVDGEQRARTLATIYELARHVTKEYHVGSRLFRSSTTSPPGDGSVGMAAASNERAGSLSDRSCALEQCV